MKTVPAFTGATALVVLVAFAWLIFGNSPKAGSLEVTRIITESVIEEVEVEVTRLVQETVLEEVEVEVTRLVEVTVVPDEAVVDDFEIAGTWQDRRTFWRFSEDGIYEANDTALEKPDDLIDAGTYTIEGSRLTMNSPAGEDLECSGIVGVYTIESISQRGIKLKPKQDGCGNRNFFYGGGAGEDSYIYPTTYERIVAFNTDATEGTSYLTRFPDQARVTVSSLNVSEDYAVSPWLIIFNYPERCVAGPYECSEADIGANRAAMGDIVFLPFASIRVGGDGVVRLISSLPWNDATNSFLPYLENECPAGYSECGGAIGGINPEGAMVTVALHSHGLLSADEIPANSLKALVEHCDGDIGTLPIDGIESLEGSDPDQCAFIQTSQHLP